MIDEFHFIWRQLKGPQIIAITKATFAWIKDMFDRIFNYYNVFSIDTANDAHLTFLGLVSGFARATVSIPSEKLFWFTDQPMHGSDHGFSDLHATPQVGGKFSDAVEDRLAKATTRLPAEVYRRILKAFVQSKGDLGSLVLLDDLTKAAWDVYLHTNYGYAFTISESTKESINYGDIIVHIGSMDEWLDGHLTIRAVYEYIENSAYKPEPRLILSFTEGNNYIELESGHGYLQAENGEEIEEEVRHESI